jgi:hypothetical protein
MTNTINSSIGANFNPITNVTSHVITGQPGTYWGNIAHGTYVGTGVHNAGFNTATADIIRLHDLTGKEIVKLTQTGEVIWADPGMNENEAAQAFSRSLEYSGELKAGVSKSVKSRMRDTVFEEIIKIAKQKGSLTADDLTYLLEASKIIERLKSG